MPEEGEVTCKRCLESHEECKRQNLYREIKKNSIER